MFMQSPNDTFLKHIPVVQWRVTVWGIQELPVLLLQLFYTCKLYQNLKIIKTEEKRVLNSAET